MSPEVWQIVQEKTQKSGLPTQAIAVGAVLAATLLFAIPKLGTQSAQASLEARAIPLDVALNNGKPTLVEFYADWCKVCKSMTGQQIELNTKYGRDVNFVLLNIDNPKWMQETTKFRVSQVPEFVFLDDDGSQRAILIGGVPQDVMDQSLNSLASHGQMPFEVTGVRSLQSSSTPITSAPQPGSRGLAGPLDHGVRT